LNAFTGILTRLEDSIGTHIWGLPSKEFGAALQWTTNLPCPGKERVGFPSWSWAGWIHASNPLPVGIFLDMYEGFDKRATDISVLTWYTVQDDKKIHTFEECNFKRISLQFNEGKQRSQCPNENAAFTRLEMKLRQYFTPQRRAKLATYIGQLPSPSKPPLSHHIFLWASCASLYVDRPPEALEHPATCDLPIRIKEAGQQIGSIRLRPEWRETEPDYMHFFVSTAGVILPSGPALHPLQLKFKVILTKLYHDTKPPVYRRIHVSHTAICETDWTLAHPESRFIALA
jgi:hypothetical protein